ncbi:hypothetical protein IM700_010110 [Paenibacillus sp. DXFW5]|uniref:DUF4433 domain-containing protein n=1 Tax=Paenibacillus rhizolycopersici TaxID=2780073 RepID=A0ABS2H6J6_9BACL|nr:MULTISPECIES: DUF6886 family protein [Paenibacillus]MBM6995998.1 hypothetical protein [Paenibacillus rhizolycopersici]GIP49373.1 hypothetical protein J53TS2_29640 [Paenibacillus sp. J53TS2]
MKLYHFSDNPDIQRFEPRMIYEETEAKVWAIDEFHAPHYFFPRECPRVCVWPEEYTTEADLNLFFCMSTTQRIIAIESAWYDQVSNGHIYRYSFNPDDFVLHEPNAGYYISSVSVVPSNVERIDDLIGSITDLGIEFRVTPSLKPLKDLVLKSSLNYSMIRLRNAVM